MSSRFPGLLASAVAAAAIALTASAAQAQRGGDGYLFHRPLAEITVRGGYSAAHAGSDLFADVTDRLTLNKSDFNGFAVGLDVAVPVSPRLDVVLSADYQGVNRGSEFRHFTDNFDRPIQQSTRFDRVPLTASLRYNLVPNGRSVGQLAWIPSSVVPWVGAGGGVMWYQFRQVGDFLDFNTNRVFSDTFSSSGWTPTAQGMAGADFSVSPTIVITAGARYLLARGDPGRDFAGFEKIDLSGLVGTLGFTFRL